MLPTISAIVPAYNRAHFLPRALGSILAQTQPVNEIIVVDDGSTDNTAEVVASFGSSIRYIHQPNRGAGAARNHGMREARCDYIAFLDSDDVWVPEKIRQQLNFIKQHPTLDFIFADMANVTAESDNNVAEIKNAKVYEYFVQHATDLKDLFECLLVENMIPTSTVMLRRSCLERVGFMDETLRIAEDLEFWLRIALCCHCGFIPAILEKRYRHTGNLINNWAECQQCHAQVLLRLLASAQATSSRTQQQIRLKVANLYYDLGSYYFERRSFADSYSYLKQGGARHVLDWKHFSKLLISALLRHPK